VSFVELAEYGMDGLRAGYTPDSLSELTRVCQRFCEREQYHHCFMLGLANHWVCVSAVKYPSADGPRHAVMLFDSLNHDHLGKNSIDVKRQLASRAWWDDPGSMHLPLQ
jgi:hypothetical protein